MMTEFSTLIGQCYPYARYFVRFPLYFPQFLLSTGSTAFTANEVFGVTLLAKLVMAKHFVVLIFAGVSLGLR